MVFILPIMTLTTPAEAKKGWTKYTSKEFGLKFELPNNFKVKEATKDYFIAESKDMLFVIFGFEDGDIEDAKEITTGVHKIYKKKFKITKAKVHDKVDDEWNGLESYEIYATGYYRRTEVNYAILGILDGDSDNNFGVVVHYPTKKEKTLLKVEEAIIETLDKI